MQVNSPTRIRELQSNSGAAGIRGTAIDFPDEESTFSKFGVQDRLSRLSQVSIRSLWRADRAR